jgi:two-component system, sensor histidine kinase PdtaS
MIKLSSSNSVKARLLVLMLFISLPVFALTVILATITYRSEIKNIEQAQTRAADDYAIRSRIWLRGVLRSLEMTLGNVSLAPENTGACQTYVASVLRTSPGYKALYVSGNSQVVCLAASDGFISDADMRQLASEIRTKPDTRRWVTSAPGRFRYDTVKLGDTVYFVFYLRNESNLAGNAEGMLIVSPELLDQVFDLGLVDQPAIIGLVSRGSDVLAARGVDERDPSWLPRQWPPGELPTRWTAMSNSGATTHYAARLVAEPDMVVLANFDGSAENAALRRYIALCAAPLVILAMIYGASWRFIQNDIVRGIAGIEKAAKAEIEGRETVLAPIDPGMPDDIRKVAGAFNRMVMEAASRESELRTSLQSNQNLMRELHHRVKNSLQVIQSYLALTRREQPDQGGEILRDAEAKVQVLAVAYRFALTDAGMEPVPLEPFIKELLFSMSDAARRSSQMIAADIRTGAELPVDRAIPLGLAIVEVAFACLKQPACNSVKVMLEKDEAGGLHLTILADGIGSGGLRMSKTLLGLQIQLGAVASQTEPPLVLNWRTEGS